MNKISYWPARATPGRPGLVQTSIACRSTGKHSSAVAHGFDGAYPSGNTLGYSSDNTFALQTGGGLNYFLSTDTGVCASLRPITSGRSSPTTTDDVQGDLRLGLRRCLPHLEELRPSP